MAFFLPRSCVKPDEAENPEVATQIPLYTITSHRGTGVRTPSFCDNIAGTRPENWPTQFSQQRKSFAADRFIPRRRNRNYDAINYNLTRVPPADKPTDVDVLNQINSLEKTWRKRLMKNAMDAANVIPGSNDRRIFNFTESKNRQSNVDTTAGQSCSDGSWRTKARVKPLIEPSNFYTIKLRRSRRDRAGSLDWGAKNFIAAIIDTPDDSSIVIFDATLRNARTTLATLGKFPLINERPFSVKWNHSGDMFAVATENSLLKVYSMEKLCWTRECRCTSDSRSRRNCEVQQIAWTHTDTEILIACDNNRVSAYTSSGQFINSGYLSPETYFITSIVFSPNDRYFAVTTMATVCLHMWPSFKPYIEIGRRTDEVNNHPMVVAWHPWDTNIMCIGACPEDGALALWDVNRQELLDCKRAKSDLGVSEIVWNKHSAELVVLWYDWNDNQRSTIVVVLSSLDRVVDFVTRTPDSSCLTWNPDHTLLALRKKRQIEIWKFFGSEEEKWYDPSLRNERKKKQMDSLKRRRAIYTDQTIHFEHYDIH